MPDEPIKQYEDCRVCKNFSFDRDVTLESFTCAKGCFDFEEEQGSTTGNRGTYDSTSRACDGKWFELDVHSQWYERLKKK